MIEAKGLYKSELFGINPYIAVYALQENYPRCKTKPQRKTCNPKFNEMFQLYVKNWKKSTETRRPIFIRIECYAFSKKSNKHDFLGTATILFKDHKALSNATGKWVELWLKLERKNPNDKVSGDVHVGVRCINPLDQQMRSASTSKSEMKPRGSIHKKSRRPSSVAVKTVSKIDPDKSFIQLESAEKILKTDVPYKFTVHLKDSKGIPMTENLANLDWEVDIVNIANGDIVDPESITQSVSSDNNHLEFVYCPSQHGEYSISVLIGEKDKLFPQRIEVVPVVDPLNTYIYGNLIEKGICLDSDNCEFFISLRDKNNQPMNAAATSLNINAIKVNVTRTNDNTSVPCKISYFEGSSFKVEVLKPANSHLLPTGEYKVDIEVANEPLLESVNFFVARATSPEKTQVANLPRFKKILSPLSFIIVACDSDGNEKQQGGDDFHVEIVSKQNNKKIVNHIEDMKNGRYLVSSILPEVGDYQVDVSLSGQFIGSSIVTARQTVSPYHCKVTGIPKFCTQDSQIVFTIEMRDLYGNPAYLDEEDDVFEIAVLNTATNTYIDMEKVQIEQNSENGDVFEVTVPFHSCAIYTVELRLNDQVLADVPSYAIVVSNGVIDPANTILSGSGAKKLYSSEFATGLIVQLCDEHGLQVPYSDETCKIGLILRNRKGEQINIAYKLVPQEDGNVVVAYSVADEAERVPRGLYHLEIQVNEVILGSLPIVVVPKNEGPDINCTEFFDLFDEIKGTNRSATVNSDFTFKLKLNNADHKALNIGNDYIQVMFAAVGDESNVKHGEVFDLQNGTYSVRWTPKEQGDYNINVFVNGHIVPLKDSLLHVQQRIVQIARVVSRSFEISTFDTNGERMNDTISESETLKQLKVVFDQEEEHVESSELVCPVLHSIQYIGNGKFRVEFLVIAKHWKGVIKVFQQQNCIGNIMYEV